MAYVLLLNSKRKEKTQGGLKYKKNYKFRSDHHHQYIWIRGV